MSEPIPPSLSDEDARRQRLEALSALAQTQLGAPAATPPLSASRMSTSRSRRPWLIIGSVLLVIVLVAGIVLHQLGRFPGATAQTHAGLTSLVIAPSLQDLDCPHDVAWSPNGQQVAVIGYRDQCPNDDPSSYNYQAGVLQIYAAATGKLVQTILPDPTVLALPGAPSPPVNVQPATANADTSTPIIDYTHVLWSPNGKQVALTFDINQWDASGTQAEVTFSGLVLVNADGTDARAALWKNISRPVAVLSFSSSTALRWDTTTMSVLPLPSQARYGYLDSLPPAQSYTWSARGQLVPASSLTAGPSSPTAPIGNPDGGSSFTIWQTGYVSLRFSGSTNNSPVTINPGVYMWDTAFAVQSPDGFLAWSPDGHYLIDSVALLGIVHPAGELRPTPAGLQALGLTNAPDMPIRDRGLQQLLTSLPASTTAADQPIDYVAWSPNGHVLAAIPEINPSSFSGGIANTPAVTTYDCATGRIVGTLRPQGDSQIAVNQIPTSFYLGSSSLLRWSADSSHLLVYSATLDTITIWGPGQLPGV